MTHREILHRALATKGLVRQGTNRIISRNNPTQQQPWLFDFRAVVLEPTWLNAYADLFWEQCGGKLPFQVCGMETAGIPLVTAIVMKGIERGTPVNGLYVRKSRKRDGLLRSIEGTPIDEPVILVDDLLNTGRSVHHQVKVLSDANLRVRDIFVILTFRPEAAYTFVAENQINLTSVFSLRDFGISPLPVNDPLVAHDGMTEIWRTKLGEPGFEYVVPKSTPVLDATRVYMGTDTEGFVCLDQARGTRVWQFPLDRHPDHKGIFSSPLLLNDTVYFGAYDGTVYALHTHDGSVKWRYTDADWIGSSPAVSEKHGLLYVGLEYGLVRKRGGIAALDVATGLVRWKDTHPELTHGTPLYVAEEDIVVIGSNDGIVYAYDARTGARRWIYVAGGEVKYAPAYHAPSRRLVIPSFSSTVALVDARDGAGLGAFVMGGGSFAQPLIVGDTAIVTSFDKHVYAFNVVTGEKTWEFATHGRIFASPILAEELVWVGSNDGCLYALDPETGALRVSHQLSERIVNAVAYNPRTRQFFVSTVANELYCLMRKKTAPADSS